MVSVEVGAHAIHDAFQTSVGVPVIDELVPVIFVQHDVSDHVDDAFAADRIRGVDEGNQLVD